MIKKNQDLWAFASHDFVGRQFNTLRKIHNVVTESKAAVRILAQIFVFLTRGIACTEK